MMRATIACRHIEGIVRVMQKPENRRKIWKSIFALLPRKQKSGFFLILLILAVSAARKANIAADIEQLEGGYQFVLAEGGTNLSGGQRQRIALARIFLKKPRILILDEATSALDNTSEKRIQAEIEKMKEECGTTVLSIAHRLSTLQNCDEIIVMDKGCIVQRGTYREPESAPGCFGTWRWGFANKLMKRVGFSPDAPLFYRFCWEIILMRPPARIMPR